MKNLLTTLFCLLIIAGGLHAQKMPKSVKKAKKALAASEYTEALNLINEALEDGETANISEVWAVKGEVLAAEIGGVTDALLKSQLPGATPVEIGDMSSARAAYDAFQMAMKKSTGEKDKGEKAAIKGMVGLATSVNAVAYELYGQGRYAEAYDLFHTMLDIRGDLMDKGNKSVLAKEEDYTLFQYHTGLSAAAAGTPEKAMPIYQKLVDANFNEALPYEMVFTSLLETDEEAAFKVLEKGKKNCAENPEKLKGLLYKEINHYVAKGETQKLESRLQDAIAQDPENPTLYNVLGSVYSTFAQESYEAGNTEQGDKQTQQAVGYYKKVIELKPEMAAAHSGIGMMYFNQAATINKEMIKLNDLPYSKETDAKYNKFKEQQGELFKNAKPHFEKALSLDKNDTIALQGLQSIAAYNNDYDAVKEYKARLEAIQNGAGE